MRDTTLLDGTWRFQPDPYGEGDRNGYHAAGFDDDAWCEVAVPSDFSQNIPEMDFYEGGGWYRRRLDAPVSWDGRRVVLRFEGVNNHARVWMNGECVGKNADPYLPFECDVSDVLQCGGANSVVVYADNTSNPGDVPGNLRGWRTFGGILRSVSLIVTDRVHLGSIATVCEADGRIRAHVTVCNNSETSSSVAASLCIDEAALELTADAVNIDAGGEVTMEMSGTLGDVEPWSPDSPRLYNATIAVQRSGEVVDTIGLRIGFRTVEVGKGVLLLNGEPIYVTGFNRHEDGAGCNMTPDPEMTRSDLELMKASGSNFVRLCHYPHDSHELDLCDELGLLVMAEVPLYWWTGKWDEENHDAKFAAAKRQLGTMIERDVNHPSVMIWSVSNENAEHAPGVVEGNRELVAIARSLDSSRLVVHVSNHWTEVRSFEDDDLIAINAYPAWGRMHKGGNEEFTLQDATAWWADELEKLHACYPEKPILVAEFGHPALPGVTNGAFGEATQVAALAAEFEAMHAPYICGALIWCFADHPWPGGFDFVRFMTVSTYGVVTRDRRPKPSLEAMARLFREKQAG
mgnify:CR=1 FL=1